jgi:ATP-dependent DNA ligase
LPAIVGTEAAGGPDWLHEIKYDSFRLMAWRDGERIRLYTRGGYDCAVRYPTKGGVVSKRRNSPYKPGTSLNWIKFKNPESAAALREATEDWGK